jgi:SAM-dependent methyltransferase
VRDRPQLQDQYRTGANLQRRIALHELFSVNSLPWQRWVFEQLALPAGARVLELGCGPGKLWLDNRERLPAGLSITLTDFSPGMLREARRNLRGLAPFDFAAASAAWLPFSRGRFDTVIANHMLYHVPDLRTSLREIRRVLRRGGTLYAATNGAAHLVELDDLRAGLIPHRPIREATASFMLENGRAALAAQFEVVELRRHEDELRITEVEPLVGYELSRTTMAPEHQPPDAQVLAAYRARVKDALRDGGGVLRVSKESGLFIAR